MHETETPMRLRHVTPASRLFAGPDALRSLPRELARLRVRRVGIVTSPSLSSRHPDLLAAVTAHTGDLVTAVFDRVQEHSPLPSVIAAAEALSGVEGIVVIGGGSAIVTSRAAAIVIGEGRPVRELATFRTAEGRLESPRLLAPKLPVWIVPTTPTTAYAKAGSAVRHPETNERLAMYDPKTRAQAVFLDPRAALTAPDELVVSSALNAFSMAVEGLEVATRDPIGEGLLRQALTLLAAGLRAWPDATSDPDLRLRLMVGALLAGQGTDHVGGGLAQALAHSTGPRSSVANGVVEALLLPHAMRFNAPVVGAGIAAVGEALSREPARPTTDDAIREVSALLFSLGVPTRLRDVGVKKQDLPEIVEHVRDDWTLTQIPRTATADELLTLLSSAW